MNHNIKILFYLLIMTTVFAVNAEETLNDAPESELVFEETPHYSYSETDSGELKYTKTPYPIVRPKWPITLYLGVGQNELTPALNSNYLFKTESINFDVAATVGYSFGFGAIGLGVPFSYLEYESDLTNLQIFRYGLSLFLRLDGLFDSPYLVPEVRGGAHSFTYDGQLYSESLRSDIAPYVEFKLSILLNWLSRQMSFEALESFGLQNSFIYVSYQYWFQDKEPSGASPEFRPVFESSFVWSAGLELEF